MGPKSQAWALSAHRLKHMKYIWHGWFYIICICIYILVWLVSLWYGLDPRGIQYVVNCFELLWNLSNIYGMLVLRPAPMCIVSNARLTVESSPFVLGNSILCLMPILYRRTQKLYCRSRHVANGFKGLYNCEKCRQLETIEIVSMD